MKRLILSIVLTLFGSLAYAGTVNVSWTPPTQCSDGGPMTNCAVTGYEIYGGLSGQAKTLVASPAGTATSYQLTNVAAGNWCYEMKAVSGVFKSTASAEACKVVAPSPIPGPPTIVTITTTAWNFTKGVDKINFAKVGTVPLGVKCDSTQPVVDKYVIPRAKVRWTGALQPSVVVGKCG